MNLLGIGREGHVRISIHHGLCAGRSPPHPLTSGKWRMGYMDLAQAQSLDVRQNLELSCLFPHPFHFPDEETEAQRGTVLIQTL